MTNEEYATLRSIAAADCTEGPNFDPALLTELLDAFDALTQARLDVIYWQTHAKANHNATVAAQALANHYRKSVNVGPGQHVTTEALLWRNLRYALGEHVGGDPREAREVERQDRALRGDDDGEAA